MVSGVEAFDFLPCLVRLYIKKNPPDITQHQTGNKLKGCQFCPILILLHTGTKENLHATFQAFVNCSELDGLSRF